MADRPTPLTDAQRIKTYGGDIVYADFARQLERDRAELLEALKTILAAGESLLGRSSKVEIDYLEAAVKMARSVIAKAKGTD